MADTPKPKWLKRPQSDLVRLMASERGYSELAARVLSGRYEDPSVLDAQFGKGLSDLDHPNQFADMDVASERIALAIINGEVIGVETDHDVDGCTSHAVIAEALVDYFNHPEEKVRSYIGHRLKEGYGLSDSVATRIIEDSPQPSLVVTADNGSSDGERITRLKREAGIDTVVTDHHGMPVEGPPVDAVATINPCREDCKFPDPLIAGCMVAWLLMASVRNKLIEKKHLPKDTPSLGYLLDYVALGTVADCVSLSRSKNNRAVIEFGLNLINTEERPCWRAFKEYMGRGQPVDAQTLAFSYGPAINARGRLDEAMAGVRFLRTKDDVEAKELAALLKEENERRKEIEQVLKLEALTSSADRVRDGAASLVVFLPNGHPGVHGIVASRVTEAFGRPSIMLSPSFNDPEVVSGSARSIEGIHLRDILQKIADEDPSILTKFGGHAMAAGLTLPKDKIDAFSKLFEQHVKKQTKNTELGPVIYTDGELGEEHLSLDAIRDLGELEPYGREFDYPVFEGDFTVGNAKPMGDGRHLSLELTVGNTVLRGVWFNAMEADAEQLPVMENEQYRMLFTLAENNFRGNRTVQAQIRDVSPASMKP